jgi:hypothetical protein
METNQEEELQEIQEKIEDLERITKDNNKVLHTIQSHMRMGTVMNILYYFVIIGSMVGAYYYFQPIVGKFIGTYQDILTLPEKIKQFGK